MCSCKSQHEHGRYNTDLKFDNGPSASGRYSTPRACVNQVIAWHGTVECLVETKSGDPVPETLITMKPRDMADAIWLRSVLNGDEGSFSGHFGDQYAYVFKAKQPDAATVLETIEDAEGNPHGVLKRFRNQEPHDPAYDLQGEDFSIFFAGFLALNQSGTNEQEVVLLRKNLKAEDDALPVQDDALPVLTRHTRMSEVAIGSAYVLSLEEEDEQVPGVLGSSNSTVNLKFTVRFQDQTVLSYEAPCTVKGRRLLEVGVTRKGQKGWLWCQGEQIHEIGFRTREIGNPRKGDPSMGPGTPSTKRDPREEFADNIKEEVEEQVKSDIEKKEKGATADMRTIVKNDFGNYEKTQYVDGD